MQKYDIPSSTEGAYGLSKSYTLVLGEKQTKDDVLPIKRYTLMWPETLEGLLIDFIDNLNDILDQRGLELKWYYYPYDGETRTRISMQGVYYITKCVDVHKLSIDLNGKVYKVKVEKLEEFLKGLE